MRCFILLFSRLSEKFSFALYAFNTDSCFWDTTTFGKKKKGILKTATSSKGEAFQMLLFNLNETHETRLLENSKIWNFSWTLDFEPIKIKIREFEED